MGYKTKFQIIFLDFDNNYSKLERIRRPDS